MYKIIILGGSAGSIEPIQSIISAIPYNFNTPIVICIHLPNKTTVSIDETLTFKTGKKVQYAKDMEMIKSNGIYIAPPMYHLQIEPDATFSFALDDYVKYSRPSISVLFETTGRSFKEHALCIALSSSSTDGLEGALIAESYNSTILAQDPKETEVSTLVESIIKNIKSCTSYKTKDIIQFIIQSERDDNHVKT